MVLILAVAGFFYGGCGLIVLVTKAIMLKSENQQLRAQLARQSVQPAKPQSGFLIKYSVGKKILEMVVGQPTEAEAIKQFVKDSGVGYTSILACTKI